MEEFVKSQLAKMNQQLQAARDHKKEIQEQQQANATIKEENSLTEELMSIVSQFQKLAHDKLLEKMGKSQYKEAFDVLQENEKTVETINKQAQELPKMGLKEIGLFLIEIAGALSDLEKIRNLSLPPRFKLSFDKEKIMEALISSASIECTKTHRSVNLFTGNLQEEEKKEIFSKKSKDSSQSSETTLGQPIQKVLIQYLENKSTVWIYDLETIKRSEKQVNCVFNRLAGSCQFGEVAYVAGGLHQGYMATLVRIDTLGNSTSCQNMITPRSGLPLGYAGVGGPAENQILFASGGRNYTGLLKKTELYRIQKNKWFQSPEFNHQRELHACCIIPGKSINLFCGQQGPGHSLNTVQQINITHNGQIKGAWKFIGLHSNFLGDWRMLALPLPGYKQIYLFGGGDEKAMYEVQADDAKINKVFQPNLIPEPYYCSVYGWVNDKLYCVGYADATFSAMPKLFSFSQGEWTIDIE